MSIEPEDSLLEEALRSDLPSPATEARLRRRLLAAGVAVGNGIATTTAAASGGGAVGVLAKAAGLSWGIKMGFAAAVVIPTVGLWLGGPSAPQTQPQAPALVAPARVAEAAPKLTQVAPAVEPAVVGEPADESAAAPSQHAAARVRPSDAPALAANPAPPPAHPSQGDFAAPDTAAPLAAPKVVASSLAEETRILDGAFAALGAGDRARAADLIHEHEARYPQGLLNKERQRAKTRLSELSRGE